MWVVNIVRTSAGVQVGTSTALSLGIETLCSCNNWWVKCCSVVTCSLKLAAVSSHLWKGNLVALCSMFFELQLKFCHGKIPKQLQHVSHWSGMLHPQSSAQIFELSKSIPSSWEVGDCHYNFTEKEAAPERSKWLSLSTQQGSGGAGIADQEVPGSCYTMLWRKVISQNSTEGSHLLLITGQQRALDVLIGHCIMSLIICN